MVPFEPLDEEEIARIDREIERVKKTIALHQGTLAYYENRKVEGQWYSDAPWPPHPEPDCYLCGHKANCFEECTLEHKYGTVCEDYEHFTERHRKEREQVGK